MQELIDKLVKEAGLSADQASKALSTMVSHVKAILPPVFADNLENLLGSKPADAAAMSASTEAPKAAGLMDKASAMAEEAKDKLTDIAGAAKEKFDAFTTKENLENLQDKAEDKLEELKDKAEDMAEDAINKLKGFFKKDD